MNDATKRQRNWTTTELETMRRLRGLGARAVARALQRSEWSVINKAARERISLRQPGERRGKVHTEPRGGSWNSAEAAARLRADVVAGKVTMEELERRVREDRGGKPLCPSCTRRPIEVPQTGLCKICHSNGVLEAYEGIQAQRNASRRLDAARARRYRGRRQG